MRSNRIIRMVHQIENNHMKISSHGRIRGSVRDATSQEMNKLHKVVKQEEKSAKTKEHDSK